ncbi:hypothetical protein ACRS8Y_28025 [Bacillus paranthracis]|uniref:hypothetical protein n=1 Tax=Bacillus paranthracis TaxID=2026186 RepID=UPI003EDF3734
MLLDNKFDIRIDDKKCKKGIVNLSVNEEELNNSSEHPPIWNKAGELEQDIATKIGHGNIKWYCRNMRRNNRGLKPAYITLYENFIKVKSNHNESIKGLYEKVCYIRARDVYRQSSVYDTENTSVHTSKYIRKEIESLRSSQELFDVNKKVFEQLFKQQMDEKETLLIIFIQYFGGSHVLETESCVKELGYTDDDIEKLKGITDELSFSTYTSHLIELLDRERFEEDYENIWMKLSGFAACNIMNGYFMMNEH